MQESINFALASIIQEAKNSVQLQPSPGLAHIVKHFLILEADRENMLSHRLFADGHSGMVFHFGEPFMQSFDNNSPPLRQPRSFTYGQISRFHNIISAGRIGMLVVVFQPYGASSLLGMPAFELNDAIIPLNTLWGSSETRDLEEQILIATNHLERIHLIENFLLKKLRKGHVPDPLVRQAVHLINQHHGMVSMSQLTQTLQSEERNLERRFRKNVGISPKAFSGTMRLQYFIKHLHNSSQRPHLTRLGYECGYYDQSHLIREFKKNVGITPHQYLSGTNLLAVNFIQFPAAIR